MSDDKLNRISKTITEGDHRAPNRSMMRAVGFTDEDFGKPIIGVAFITSKREMIIQHGSAVLCLL